MTEDEAKTKWCPLSMSGGVDAWSTCHASECMMWQQTDNECDPQPTTDNSEAKCYPAGYCGLADKQ